MRVIVLVVAAFLAACAPRAQQPEAQGCARSATHPVTFSNSQTPDTIVTRSDGPSCAQAIVTFVLRNAQGDPLWTLANTHYDMTAGGTPSADGAPAVTEAQMDAFLSGWANVQMQRTSTLPEWRAGAESLTASVEGFSYSTALPRDSYEMLRARDLPLLCYAAAAEAVQCLVMDPATGSPTMMVAYGP